MVDVPQTLIWQDWRRRMARSMLIGLAATLVAAVLHGAFARRAASFRDLAPGVEWMIDDVVVIPGGGSGWSSKSYQPRSIGWPFGIIEFRRTLGTHATAWSPNYDRVNLSTWGLVANLMCLWSCAWLLVGVPAARRRRIMRHRLEHGYCPYCGYDISAVRSPRCSECGGPTDRTSLLTLLHASAELSAFDGAIRRQVLAQLSAGFICAAAWISVSRRLADSVRFSEIDALQGPHQIGAGLFDHAQLVLPPAIAYVIVGTYLGRRMVGMIDRARLPFSRRFVRRAHTALVIIGAWLICTSVRAFFRL